MRHEHTAHCSEPLDTDCALPFPFEHRLAPVLIENQLVKALDGLRYVYRAFALLRPDDARRTLEPLRAVMQDIRSLNRYGEFFLPLAGHPQAHRRELVSAEAAVPLPAVRCDREPSSAELVSTVWGCAVIVARLDRHEVHCTLVDSSDVRRETISRRLHDLWSLAEGLHEGSELVARPPVVLESRWWVWQGGGLAPKRSL